MQEEVAIYNLRWFFSLLQLFTIKLLLKKKKKKEKPTLWLLKTPFSFEMKMTYFQRKQTPASFLPCKSWILQREKKKKK